MLAALERRPQRLHLGQAAVDAILVQRVVPRLHHALAVARLVDRLRPRALKGRASLQRRARRARRARLGPRRVELGLKVRVRAVLPVRDEELGDGLHIPAPIVAPPNVAEALDGGDLEPDRRIPFERRLGPPLAASGAQRLSHAREHPVRQPRALASRRVRPLRLRREVMEADMHRPSGAGVVDLRRARLVLGERSARRGAIGFDAVLACCRVQAWMPLARRVAIVA